MLLSQPGSSREWEESHTAAFGGREQELKFPHQDLKENCGQFGKLSCARGSRNLGGGFYFFFTLNTVSSKSRFVLPELFLPATRKGGSTLSSKARDRKQVFPATSNYQDVAKGSAFQSKVAKQ